MLTYGAAQPRFFGGVRPLMSSNSAEILARRGVHFIHSPASMSAKGPHPAPVRAIQEAGINIALGSDNMTEDMFQSMKSAMTLHRGAWGRSRCSAVALASPPGRRGPR